MKNAVKKTSQLDQFKNQKIEKLHLIKGGGDIIMTDVIGS